MSNYFMPGLFLVECGVCKHEWVAFCPLGYDRKDFFECPRCGIIAGEING